MKIIDPSYKILNITNPAEIYKNIETAARTCYKSESKVAEGSAAKMIKTLIKNGHEAMLEHGSMTVRFIVDRGVSHEIVRHRLCSFAQESTRYCRYDGDRFGNEITVIDIAPFCNTRAAYEAWRQACLSSEAQYMKMLEQGTPPEIARSVLPNSLKTEIVVTSNMREWRHILNLRAADATGKAHPQMKQVMVPLLKELDDLMPELFDDIVEQLTE